jgi:hypothetical protein
MCANDVSLTVDRQLRGPGPGARSTLQPG